MSGCVIWLTGIPASGKTTLAGILAGRLRGAGALVEILDGDEIRKALSRGLSTLNVPITLSWTMSGTVSELRAPSAPSR